MHCIRAVQMRSRSPRHAGGLTRQSTLPAEDASRRLDRALPALLGECVEMGALLTLHCLVCALRRAHVDPLVAGSSSSSAASFADLLACPRKESTASTSSGTGPGAGSAFVGSALTATLDSNVMEKEKRLAPPVPSAPVEPSAPIVRYTCSFKQFLELCSLIKLTCAFAQCAYKSYIWI